MRTFLPGCSKWELKTAVNIEIAGAEGLLDMKLVEIRQFICCFENNSYIDYI